MKFEIVLSKKLKLSLFFFLLLVFVTGASFVLAARDRWRAPEVEYPPVPFLNVERPNDFIEKIRNEVPGYTPDKALSLYVRYFYSLFLMISGLIAFGAVFFGGFLYLISSGNPTRMMQAREQITAGVLGLILLLSSYLILTTLNPQLIVSASLNINRIAPPVIDIPKIDEGEGPSLFQVPTGRIIERATLDVEGKRKLTELKNLVQSVRTDAENLKKLTEDLKNITDKCVCGTSICGSAPGCGGAGCDGAVCDLSARDAKIDEIQNAIKTLKEKQNQIIPKQRTLVNDYTEFKQAGLLMSIPLGVMDYNSMLGYRYYVEQTGQEAKISSDEIPLWNDNIITQDGVKIADPASFYFDKNKTGNEQAIQLALSLPFMNSPFPEGPGPYPIPGTIDPPPFQPPGDTPNNLVDMAKYIGSVTGLRPAFILGLTKSESNWNPYAGGPYTREKICYCPASTMDWKASVCDILEKQITPGLNLDPFDPAQVRVSQGSATSGCGGAMGAGQIMPFTWIGVESRVSAITNNYPPSPWNLYDGLAASGVVLLDKYAYGETGPLKSCETEKRLTFRYFGCNPDNLTRCQAPWYGDKVVAVSEEIAINEDLERCTR